MTQAKQIINLLLLNNFHPVMSYRRVQKESDELLYTIWSLVMVRNQLSNGNTFNLQNEYFSISVFQHGIAMTMIIHI